MSDFKIQNYDCLKQLNHDTKIQTIYRKALHLFDGRIITEEMKRTLEAAEQELVESE